MILTPRPKLRRYFRCRTYLLASLAWAAVFLPQLFGGGYGYGSDSGLYAGVSDLIYSRGDWLTLMAGDRPYFNKPPLAFWIHGLFLHLLGPHLWAMRLPNFLASLGCILLTVHIARRLAGSRVALFAGLILATSYDFLRYPNRFILDYWHTFFVLIAVALCIESVRRSRHALLIWAGVPVGLACLVKPFMALLTLPLIAVWLLTLHRLNRRSALCLGTALLIAAIIAAPWHLAMIAIHGSTFIDNYFGREIIHRSASEERPVWWYFQNWATNYWPWLLLVVLGLLNWLRADRFRRDIRPAAFALVWTGCWIALALAFGDKRDRYLMQILPTFALIAAVWWSRWSPAFLRTGNPLRLDLLIAFCLLASIAVTLSPIHINLPPKTGWTPMIQFIRQHPRESYYLHPAIHFREGGSIYMQTGIWPHNASSIANQPVIPPANAAIICDSSRSTLPPGPVLFSDHQFTIVRNTPREP